MNELDEFGLFNMDSEKNLPLSSSLCNNFEKR